MKACCTPYICRCTVHNMSHPSKLDRAAIIAAGMELLAREGLRGLSLRAIAGALDVAPNALYHHVADRKALETMLAAEVSVLLHAAIRRKTQTPTRSSEGAIRALAAEYMRFAREQHLLYEALLVPRPAVGADAIGPEQLWLFVLNLVTQVSGKAAAHEATVALWALLHGMASLQSVNAFNDEKPFSSFDFGLQAWMQAANAARLTGEDKARSKIIKVARKQAAVRRSR
jgi:AcrR family transcriptional regulator